MDRAALPFYNFTKEEWEFFSTIPEDMRDYMPEERRAEYDMYIAMGASSVDAYMKVNKFNFGNKSKGRSDG